MSDIPETSDWGKAEVGEFYRPIQKSLTIHLGADVPVWLGSRSKLHRL
jgi:hypothetical protein